jgi:hypothetical protein
LPFADGERGVALMVPPGADEQCRNGVSHWSKKHHDGTEVRQVDITVPLDTSFIALCCVE